VIASKAENKLTQQYAPSRARMQRQSIKEQQKRMYIRRLNLAARVVVWKPLCHLLSFIVPVTISDPQISAGRKEDFDPQIDPQVPVLNTPPARIPQSEA
jgi:hypothetical protein